MTASLQRCRASALGCPTFVSGNNSGNFGICVCKRFGFGIRKNVWCMLFSSSTRLVTATRDNSFLACVRTHWNSGKFRKSGLPEHNAFRRSVFAVGSASNWPTSISGNNSGIFRNFGICVCKRFGFGIRKMFGVCYFHRPLGW